MQTEEALVRLHCRLICSLSVIVKEEGGGDRCAVVIILVLGLHDARGAGPDESSLSARRPSSTRRFLLAASLESLEQKSAGS